MKKTSIAFTGHRPARFSFGYDENNDTYINLKAVISEWIEAFISIGIKTFYSGFALGVDIWAAEIVLEMKKNMKA